MANVKINDLTLATNLDSTMQLETDIGGTTANKITVDQLTTFVSDSILPVNVANGGTGATSLTSHGVLLGNGTSAVTATSELSDGQVLVGRTGNAPIPTTLTAGSGISITNASGSVTIAQNSPVIVANGGTGATSLTSHGVLLGNGTSAITATSELSNGQILIGSTGNAPVAATLTAGSNVTITNSAGGITIAATGISTPVSVSNGGTGVTSLTSHGVLLGNGTSAVSASAEMSDGQVLIGRTGNTPVPATLTAGSGITITNSAGSVSIASSAAGVSNNIIYGGNFGLNPFQRGFSWTSAANNQYIADRFYWSQSGAGTVDTTQSTDAPTIAQAGIYSNGSLAITVSTAAASPGASDFYGIGHKIEGFDFQTIAQRSFTFSFWVKSPVSGIHSVAFKNGAGDYSYIQEYTVASANTWQLVNFTVPASPSAGTWGYGNSIGMRIFFAMAAGSTYRGTAGSWQNADYLASSNQVNAMATSTGIFKVQLVKLDPGSNYIPYVNIPYGELITKLQRYYLKTYDLTSKPGGVGNTSNIGYIYLPGTVANAAALINQFHTPVRTPTPTITIYSPNSGTAGFGYNYNSGADVALIANFAGQSSFVVQNNTGGSLASPSIGYHYTIEAEL